jgi:hypothetical protein
VFVGGPYTRAVRAAAEASLEFSHDGVVVLAGLLGRRDIHELRREAGSALERPLPPGCERPNNTLVPLRWDSPIVQRVLAAEERRLRIAEAVSARDLRWISGYISVKAPHSGPVWWHQDWWCWAHPISFQRQPAQVALLCYLVDTSVENGALRVLPGTHHRSIELHAALDENEDGLLESANPAARDHPAQLTLELAAGDAALVDYRLLHGTHANGSDVRRDCVLLTFAPSWRELPVEIRAHLIRHPALPCAAERARARAELPLLPAFEGVPRDLELSRIAPPKFDASS